MKSDSTVKKISSATSPLGEMGQRYLISGKRVSLRLWSEEKPQSTEATNRDYETVGYVIAGLEPFTAIEATAPPAQVHGRDTTASPNHEEAGKEDAEDNDD